MDTSNEDALFGRWLRHRRKALDLTQKELARRVGCSPATIRKLEADERRPSKHVAIAIAGVLGVPGPERDAFVRFARAGWADDPPDHPAHDLERPWLARHGRGQAARVRPGVGAPAPPAVGAAAEDTARPLDVDGWNARSGQGRFLARDAELKRLDVAMQRAARGHGGIVLLTGEAGQGKTALMAAFAARALAAHPDLIAVTGSCNAYTGWGDAFAPFREILRQLAGEDPPATDRPDHDARLRARLAASFPDVVSALVERGPHLLDTLVPASLVRAPADGGVVHSLAASTALDPGNAAAGHAAVRAETVAVLSRVTAGAPLLLLLDDLQWADASTLELLLQLARVAVRLRLLVVAAFRPEGAAGAGRPLGRAVRELERRFGDLVIDLGRSDARAFLEAWVDAEPNELGGPFRGALWRQTAGQPLFTIELMRAMKARGDLVKDSQGRWVAGGELRWDALPGRVAGALGERIARLDGAASGVLRVGAVEGEVFTAEVVARVLDLAPMEAARLLGETLDREQRLVAALDVRRTAAGQRVSRYRFRHNLIQRYLLEQIGATERSYLHEAVAQASVALLGDEADPLATGHHFTEAQAPQAAAPYYRTAGDRARRAGAVAEAIAAYRPAATHWPPEDALGKAEVLRELGRCLYLRGEHDEAIPILEEARAACERVGDDATQASIRALMANVAFDRRPEGRLALDAYEQTLATLESAPETAESAEVARVLALMGSLHVNHDNDRARALATRSLAMAERIGAEEERVTALVRLGDIIADTVPARREEGRAMIEAGLQQARRLNLVEAVTYSMRCLANLHWGVGRLDEAEATWRALFAFAEAHGLEPWRRPPPMTFFALTWRRGRWRDGAPRLLTARERTTRHAAVRFALCELDLGRASVARSLIAPWPADRPGINASHRAQMDRARLRVAAALGDEAGADRAAFGFLEAAGTHPTYPHDLLQTALDSVRWLTARPGDAAREGTAQALHILDTVARQWSSPDARATLACAHGLLSRREGAAAEARHYRRAAEAWRRSGFPLDEARARSAAAQAEHAAGDAVAADASLTRARTLLDGLASQLPDGELAASFDRERRRLLGDPLVLP